MSATETPGQVFQTVRQRCPDYPKGGAVPVHSHAALQRSSQTLFASVESHPAARAQTEARYRISFSRSRQKRGPPALPC